VRMNALRMFAAHNFSVNFHQRKRQKQ
jgi:hypothetical protein